MKTKARVGDLVQCLMGSFMRDVIFHVTAVRREEVVGLRLLPRLQQSVEARLPHGCYRNISRLGEIDLQWLRKRG